MHIPSILKFSLLIFTSLCIAAPTSVTSPVGAVVEYPRASQGSQEFHSPINLVELGELGGKNDGSVDLVRISKESDGFGFVEKHEGSVNSIQLPEKRNEPVTVVQLQDSPIGLVQPLKRDSSINLFQLPEKRQDSPINLVELGHRQLHKHKSMHPRNVQDAPINLLELSNRAKAKYLETRQNDCGSSPYQNPSCSAATGLSVRAFTVVTLVMAAIMMV